MSTNLPNALIRPCQNSDNKKDSEREVRSLTDELAKVQSKLESASLEEYRYRIAKTLHRHDLSDGPLPNVGPDSGRFVWLAVALKGFFEFAQESLVGSVVNRMLFDLRNLFYRRAIHLDAK